MTIVVAVIIGIALAALARWLIGTLAPEPFKYPLRVVVIVIVVIWLIVILWPLVSGLLSP